MSLYTTPGVYLDGLCIYDYPSQRRVLSEMSKTGLKNLTIKECENICRGLLFKIILKKSLRNEPKIVCYII